MRRTLFVVSAGLCSALLSVQVAAQFAKPNPMSQKYRDAGAKPTGGRSGSAALEIRALRDLSGSTDLEVTTGQFEGAAPRGKLDKVQVKLLTGTGESMQTDNYRKTLTGNGYAAFTYDDLRRGQKVQVQANVSGIDPNRTDVVTVSTDVLLRPDIEALAINAPAQVLVNAPVVVTGTMGEANGDVGARATCRLLVDGVEVGAIANAWVDAASNVICQFNTSFATAGSRVLTLRVTDVNPGDYDGGNNDVAATVNVVEPVIGQPFRYLQVWADDGQYDQRHLDERQFVRTGGGISTWTREYHLTSRYQSYGAYGEFAGPLSLTGGRVRLTHATDGVALPLVEVALADLPNGWSDGAGNGCRDGYLATGTYVYGCSQGGYSWVQAYRYAQHVVYVIDRASSGGEGYWYGSWDNSGTTYDTGDFISLGSSFTAELLYSDDSIAHAGALTVALQPSNYFWDNWANPVCWSSTWSEGTESGCHRQFYSQVWRSGSFAVVNP